MGVVEVAQEICNWLLRTGIVFVFERAQEVAQARYQVSVHQFQPTEKRRVFDVVPTEVADSWNVVEVA